MTNINRWAGKRGKYQPLEKRAIGVDTMAHFEEIKARRYIAQTFGLPCDFSIAEIDELINERIEIGLALIDDYQMSAAIKTARMSGCACENCTFVRRQAAWIDAQFVSLELEAMSERRRIQIQDDINFETDRMSRVIREGCNVQK